MRPLQLLMHLRRRAPEAGCPAAVSPFQRGLFGKCDHQHATESSRPETRSTRRRFHLGDVLIAIPRCDLCFFTNLFDWAKLYCGFVRKCIIVVISVNFEVQRIVVICLSFCLCGVIKERSILKLEGTHRVRIHVVLLICCCLNPNPNLNL